MPYRSIGLGVCVAAVALAVSALAPLTVRASRQEADARADFVRPALDRAAPDDPLWRLGQQLFFDRRLSGAGTMSCATCHQPDQSWTDHQARAIGEARKPLAFRAPTLLNAGQIERYGWSGRFPDVESVAFFAMSSPTNMNGSVPTVLARLGGAPDVAEIFRAAFPDGAISKHHVGLALGRYVRSITSDKAPFDHWVAGDGSAIGPAAVRGFRLFTGKARCAECHSGWPLTDGSFHDIGLARDDDIGRGKLFPTSIKLQHAFKTPTLRNVAERAPYMHDGSIATLEAVIDHYDRGGIDRPSRANVLGPLGLTPREKADLIAFLKTLTSGTTFVARSSDH